MSLVKKYKSIRKSLQQELDQQEEFSSKIFHSAARELGLARQRIQDGFLETERFGPVICPAGEVAIRQQAGALTSSEIGKKGEEPETSGIILALASNRLGCGFACPGRDPATLGYGDEEYYRLLNNEGNPQSSRGILFVATAVNGETGAPVPNIALTFHVALSSSASSVAKMGSLPAFFTGAGESMEDSDGSYGDGDVDGAEWFEAKWNAYTNENGQAFLMWSGSGVADPNTSYGSVDAFDNRVDEPVCRCGRGAISGNKVNPLCTNSPEYVEIHGGSSCGTKKKEDCLQLGNYMSDISCGWGAYGVYQAGYSNGKYPYMSGIYNDYEQGDANVTDLEGYNSGANNRLVPIDCWVTYSTASSNKTQITYGNYFQYNYSTGKIGLIYAESPVYINAMLGYLPSYYYCYSIYGSIGEQVRGDMSCPESYTMLSGCACGIVAKSEMMLTDEGILRDKVLHGFTLCNQAKDGTCPDAIGGWRSHSAETDVPIGFYQCNFQTNQGGSPCSKRCEVDRKACASNCTYNGYNLLTTTPYCANMWGCPEYVPYLIDGING